MRHSIALNDILFVAPDGHEVLRDVTLVFGSERTGIVGDNGVGKTTLLRLVAGEIEPTSGNVVAHGLRIAYLRQDGQLLASQTVGRVVSEAALDEACVFRALRLVGLQDIDMETPVAALSGGERMRVRLAAVIAQGANMLLLDEPTNDLDAEHRLATYDFIRRWDKGMIVVSHDRALLEEVDRIVELTPAGAVVYGGNYTFYVAERDRMLEARERHVSDALTDLRRTRRQAQDVRERQEKRMGHGKRRRESLGMGKALLNEMASNAGKTSGRLIRKHTDRISAAHERLTEAKRQVFSYGEIHVDLRGSAVPSGKLLCRFGDVSYAYQAGRPIIRHFNLDLFGPERVALLGSNGSGKTTLARLLIGEIQPQAGSVFVGTDRLAYLDQRTDGLMPDTSLLEQVQRKRACGMAEAREWLSQFLFTGKDVEKNRLALSGGERMRAALAVVLASREPPQLLVLDEPTNNLDLRSAQHLEEILRQFGGCLVVISHDRHFLDAIGITKEVVLG